MGEVKRYWIYKGTSNFCEELILDDNCENMVKQKPDGFYDIVSTADTIEGGVEVVLASDYEKLKAQLGKAESVLNKIQWLGHPERATFKQCEGMEIYRCSTCDSAERAREYFKENNKGERNE